jgi:hypothetical protein
VRGATEWFSDVHFGPREHPDNPHTPTERRKWNDSGGPTYPCPKFRPLMRWAEQQAQMVLDVRFDPRAQPDNPRTLQWADAHGPTRWTDPSVLQIWAADVSGRTTSASSLVLPLAYPVPPCQWDQTIVSSPLPQTLARLLRRHP